MCSTEFAAKMRCIFTAVADIHSACSHTCKNCTAVRGNERVTRGNHVFREARIGQASEFGICFPTTAGKDYALVGLNIHNRTVGLLYLSSDDGTLVVYIDVYDFVFQENLTAFTCEIFVVRHHDASSGHESACRLRFASAFSGVFPPNVMVRLVMLRVVLTGPCKCRKEFNAVFFQPNLSSRAPFRILLDEFRCVLSIFVMCRICQLFVELLG